MDELSALERLAKQESFTVGFGNPFTLTEPPAGVGIAPEITGYRVPVTVKIQKLADGLERDNNVMYVLNRPIVLKEIVISGEGKTLEAAEDHALERAVTFLGL